MNKAFFPCLLLAGLFLTGCNRAPSTAAPPTANSTVNGTIATKNVPVSGQVFIVTRGGENFKLGLVEVKIADSDTVDIFKKSFASNVNQKLSAAKSAIEEALPAYKTSVLNYRNGLTDYIAAQEALTTALSGSGITYLSTMSEVDGVTPAQAANIFNLDKQRADIGAKISPLRDDALSKCKYIHSLNDEQQAAVSGATEDFILNFPKQASTETDADGKFSLSVPAGKKYVMVAKASRDVGDSSEYYNWIVDVDLTTTTDGLTVMLSNNNQVKSVPELSIDTSLVADTLPNLSEDELATQPTSFTFKDTDGNTISPNASVTPANPIPTN